MSESHLPVAAAAFFMLAAIGLAGCPSASGFSETADASPIAMPGATDALPSTWPSAEPSAMDLPADPTTQVDVTARDLAFAPTQIAVSSTGSTRIVVHNEGFVVHNLTVDELGVQIVVSRGGLGEAILTDPLPGTYVFYCSVSGHREAGMLGTLIVS